MHKAGVTMAFQNPGWLYPMNKSVLVIIKKPRTALGRGDGCQVNEPWKIVVIAGEGGSADSNTIHMSAGK